MQPKFVPQKSSGMADVRIATRSSPFEWIATFSCVADEE